MTKILNISSWGGGGKSVCLSLIDNHPNVGIIPTHDKTPFLQNLNYSQLKSLNDFRQIKKELCNNGYLNFHLMSRDRYIDVHLSSKDSDVLKVPVDFDYYDFEKTWINHLPDLSCWNTRTLTNLIYNTYNKQIYGSTKDVTAIMGVDNIQKTKNFILNFPDSYTVFIYREPVDIIYTKLNRNLLYSSAKKYNLVRRYIFFILESFRLSKYYKDVELLVKLYNNTLIINFTELLEKPNTVLDNICHGLGIDPLSADSSSTYFGNRLQKNNVYYLGQNNDDALKKMNKSDYYIIKTFYKLFSIIFSIFLFCKNSK